MKRILFRFMVVSLLVLLMLNETYAQSVSIQEQKDAWVCSCAPTANNYGAYPKLYQGAYYQNGHKCFARTFIQWDISSLPKESSVTKATMELKCTAVHGNLTGMMVFYRIVQSWDQKSVTDTQSPNCTSKDSILVNWPASGTWLSIDITKYVQYWLAHPDSNFGILGHCCNTTGSGTGAVELNNWQYSKSQDRPKLTINYSTPTDVNQGRSTLPLEFKLDTYPNPFNPSINIYYSIEKRSAVSLSVFDLNGRQIAQLVNNYQDAGIHNYVWNAGGFGSGIYFVCLNSGKNQAVKKVVLLK